MGNLKDSILKITKSIADTSSNVVKSTKLSMEIAAAEDKLKEKYVEIGKKVYEIYAYGGELGEFFDGKYIEILEQEKAIRDLRSILDKIKGMINCPKCDTPVAKSSRYCPKCGYDMQEITKEDLIKDSTKESKEEMKININNEDSTLTNNKEQTKKVCSVCQFENDSNDTFCVKCGRTL